MRFTHTALPGRVVFERGAAARALGDEIDRLGWSRIMLIASEREAPRADELTVALRDRIAVRFTEVKPHVPSTVAEHARRTASEHDCDGILAIGGGSTIGTAKIVALTTGIGVIAVPTTFSGSEMTPVWGMTTDGRKETGRNASVLPAVVVYDADLVAGLPRELAIASSLNALAHCLESVWVSGGNPISTLTALEGARAIAEGLRMLTADDPLEVDSLDGLALESLLYGAYLAGSAFAVVGSGLHHKICHALGGFYDLPHAQTHAIVLPHVLAFTAPAIGADAARIGAALAAPESVAAGAPSPDLTVTMSDLYTAIGAPRSLVEVGLSRDQLTEAVDVVASKLPIDHVRPVSRADIEQILSAAFG